MKKISQIEDIENEDVLDDIMIEYHKNIHSAMQCNYIYDEISNHAHVINELNHGETFSVYQKLALEGMVLRICNIYEPKNNKFVKYSVDHILELLKDREPRNPDYLREFTSFLDVEIVDTDDMKEVFRSLVASKMPNRSRSLVLKRLIEFRNDHIAHPKFFEENASGALPSFEEITSLIEWGEKFGDAVSSAYLSSFWDHPTDAGRIVKGLDRLFTSLNIKDEKY